MANQNLKMKYTIELKTDPETWTIKMFQDIQRAAIIVKENKLKAESKAITDNLMKKLKTDKP